MIDLIIPLLVGYWFQRKNLFPPGFYESLIKIALQVVYPLLAIMSFWTIHIDKNLLWLPLFGVFLHIVPGILAYCNVNRKYSNPADRGSYLLSAILSNQLVVGGISVYILYGETGYAYVQLAVLLQGLILFLVCFPLAQYYHRCGFGSDGEYQITLRSIFLNRNQIGVLGILLGIILNVSGLERPTLGGSLFNLMVHVNAWIHYWAIPTQESLRPRFFRLLEARGDPTQCRWLLVK